jgi:hypothetical protein
MARVSISFKFKHAEHSTMFTLTNGYDIDQLGAKLTPRLRNNLIVLNIPIDVVAKAATQAFSECVTTVCIVGIQFGVINESIVYSVSDVGNFVIGINIDPSSAKFDTASGNIKA